MEEIECRCRDRVACMSGSGVLAVLTFARNRASGRRWLAFFVHSWAARAEWRLLSVETRSTEPRRGMMKGDGGRLWNYLM
jgi:hypothetical protein